MRGLGSASIIRRPRAEETPSGSDEDDSQTDESSVYDGSNNGGDDDAEMYDCTIQNEVRAALDACASGPQGASAWSAQYADACNPYLDIRDFGVLGLPVSSAEAQRLCQHSKQAGFATNLGGSFLVPADRLAFLNNRAWDTWLNQVVAVASEQLGAPAQLTRYELAHLSVSRGEEVINAAPTSYATLVVVLPSLHAGGNIRVKLRSQESSQDSGSDTRPDASMPLHTVAQAWYWDTSLDRKPVTEGVRLALTYHLLFTGTSQQKPSAPIRDALLIGLERALQNWKQQVEDNKQNCPTALAYVLKQRLPSSKATSFNHLTGGSCTVTHCLREIASRVGFRVALGRFIHTKQGEAYDGPGDFLDPEDAHLDNVMETRSVLKLFSDDGTPLGRGNDKFDLRQLLLDDNYFDTHEPDRRKWEEIGNPWRGTALCHHYDRLVVVVWPCSKHATMLASVGGQDAALNELKASTTTAPSSNDLNNVSIVLAKPLPAALSLLADLAVRWNDHKLWQDVLQATPAATALNNLGSQRISAALVKFGWPRMQPSVGDIVADAASAGARLSFVTCLEQQFTNDDILTSHWSNEEIAEILFSTLDPGVGDIETIVQAAVRSSDIMGTLQRIILPQLSSLSLAPTWWAAFVRRFQAEIGPTKLASDWQPPVFEASQKSLLEGIKAAEDNQKRSAFLAEACKLWQDYPPSDRTLSEMRQWTATHFLPPVPEDVPLISDIMKQTPTFLETTLLPLMSRSTFDQPLWTALLRHLCLLGESSSINLLDNWEIPTGQILNDMLATHMESLQTNDSVLDLLDNLLSAVRPNVYLTNIVGTAKRAALRALKPLKLNGIESDLPCILTAAEKDPEFATTSMIAQFRAMSLPSTFWHSALRETQARMTGLSQSLGPTVAQRLLSDMTTEAIEKIIPQQQADTRPPALATARSAAVTELVKLIDMCRTAGAQDTCNLIFRKVFAFCDAPDKVHQIIMPLALELVKLLNRHRKALTSCSIAACFREAIRRYLTEVVTYRLEPESLTAWSRQFQSPCTCATCEAIASLIRTSDAQSKVVWNGGAGPLRNHVHSTWTAVRVSGISCNSLKVKGASPAVQFTKLVGDRDPLIPLSVKDRLQQVVNLMNLVRPKTVWQQVYADTPVVLQAVRNCLAGRTVQPHLLGTAEVFDRPPTLAATPVERAVTSTVPLKRKREDEIVECGPAPTKARVEPVDG